MLAIQRFLPLLVLAISALAWLQPQPLLGLEALLLPLFSLMAFGLSFALRRSDLKRMRRQPRALLLAAGLPLIVLPLLAWLTVSALSLDIETALGILVASLCVGGIFVCALTFIAGGDLLLALISTLSCWLIAPHLTAHISTITLGLALQLPFALLAVTVLKIIVLPMLAGFIVQRLMPKTSEAAYQYLPAFMGFLVLLSLAIQMALYANVVSAINSGQVFLLIALVCAAYSLSYLISVLCRCTPAQSRAITLAIGFINGLLATQISYTYFGASAIPALYAALSLVLATTLAAYWKWQTERQVRNSRT